jgi:hypothetical protein
MAPTSPADGLNVTSLLTSAIFGAGLQVWIDRRRQKSSVAWRSCRNARQSDSHQRRANHIGSMLRNFSM